MSQHPREAGDGRLLVPVEVEFDPTRSAYLARFGDRLVDPFEPTADKLLLAESFARLPLDDRAASQGWFMRHGAVDRMGRQGLVLAAGGVRAAGRAPWDTQDEEALVYAEQEGIAWFLTTLARLSEHRSTKEWDPAWGQVILDGAAEGMVIGGPQAGSLVWPSLSWADWVADHRAEPASAKTIEEQTERLAATDGWPRVLVINGARGNIQLAPDDRTELNVIDEIEARAAVLGTTWEETVELARLVLEPYLQIAVERLFTTDLVPRSSDEDSSRILVPREKRVWRSVLLPIQLQIFEALRRITEGQPGAATCRECGRPFLVLDARRRFFCNERERFRNAQRERRKRLAGARPQ